MQVGSVCAMVRPQEEQEESRRGLFNPDPIHRRIWGARKPVKKSEIHSLMETGAQNQPPPRTRVFVEVRALGK